MISCASPFPIQRRNAGVAIALPLPCVERKTVTRGARRCVAVRHASAALMRPGSGSYGETSEGDAVSGMAANAWIHSVVTVGAVTGSI
jgi:hypothetical protein